MKPMSVFAIDGAESVGKSTMLKLVQYSDSFEKDVYVMPDLAREWYEKNIITPAEMGKEQHEEKQLDILHEYITHLQLAKEMGKDVLVDSSIITMCAYSVDCMRAEYMSLMYDCIMNTPHTYKSVVLAPYRAIEEDPVRFGSDSYRIKIHNRIMNLVANAGVETFIPAGDTAEEKAREAITFFNSELFPE